MKEVIINNKKYDLVKDEKEGFSQVDVEEKMTDYFEEFDIVVGDWAYGKLRLKGFNEKGSKNFKPINDAKRIENYIEKNCAYGCKWFEIKKKN